MNIVVEFYRLMNKLIICRILDKPTPTNKIPITIKYFGGDEMNDLVEDQYEFTLCARCNKGIYRDRISKSKWKHT